MKYAVKKLCSIRVRGRNRILPAGSIIEINDADLEKFTGLDLVEAVDAQGSESADIDTDTLDQDGFVAWVASGAKVKQVIEWIGSNKARAEIAISDGRTTVQRHIEALLYSDTKKGVDEEE